MTVDDNNWRKSSRSVDSNCVLLGRLPDGAIGLRNSNQPDAGTLRLSRLQLAGWLDGIKAGEFDDLLA
jgi:hypothetical protein